jgi:hypothetical protein
MDVTVRTPGRIEGRERIKHETISRLGEAAVFANLAECLAGQRIAVGSRRPFGFEDTDWTLADMPEATLKEYQDWCDRPPIDIETVRRSASELVADWHQRQEELYKCKDCERSGPDYQYACRTCGYSRNLFKYPIVRYGSDDSVYDVPMDAAGIVRLRPESLSLQVRPYFNKEGMMTAERVLQFDARTLPNGYIPGLVAEHELKVDSAEDLARPQEIVIERWTESEERSRTPEKARARIHGLAEHAEAWGYLQSPESCMQALQMHIAQRLYRERRDSDQTAKRLELLRKKVGEYGLELAYEYSSAGMGENDAKFMLARQEDGYVDVQPITYEIDVQHGIEKALSVLIK